MIKRLKEYFKDFDKIELELLLQDTTVDEEFAELLIENYERFADFEKALQTTKGIIYLENFQSPYEEMISRAKLYKLENEVEQAFDKYINEGYHEERASQMALWDWDI